jgi:UDP-N-acetylglucosamine-lysosomal-enzyme
MIINKSLSEKAIFSFLLILLNHVSALPSSVDIVYTWVDGGDPEWKRIKNHYLELSNLEKPVSLDSSSDSRFNDHQELKYSLRSIWKYAPFVNHIYIVTMGQKPYWFKEHPKITFIDHKDIFVNLDHLPTFNSQAIEAHLHRIKGLSEYFIYFNDDVFLGNRVRIEDFFTEDNSPLVYLEPHLSPKGMATTPETVYRQCWRNNN